MRKLKLNRSIVSITQISTNENGRVQRVRVYKKKEGKSSKNIRPLEKVVLKLVKEQRRAADKYIARHYDSNSLERDGWAKDYSENLVKAYRRLDRKWLQTMLFDNSLARRANRFWLS